MIYEKLMKARLMLQSKQLKKSGHNKFAGYDYFELGDFLPVVQEIFAELRICGIVSYGETIASLIIVDMEDQTKIEITSPMGSAALKGCHEVQNIGAVETYQRRYLWVTAMEIVEHDALDAVTGADKPASAKSISLDVWDNLPADEQEFLGTIAAQVIKLIHDKDLPGAVDFIASNNLDTDEKIALWSRFDSKQRSALTKEGEKRRQLNYAEQA